MSESREKLLGWLSQQNLDQEIREELQSLTAEEDIHDRFYRNLEFGTGGLRGILGAGTNRMNIYTVRHATQGLADYINMHYGKESLTYTGDKPAVAISYDSRIKSDSFALEAACVLAANNIKSYIYPELMPTPALSFAVRYYGCCAGIMVTASHNPSQYNGYKVYNDEGCQMTLEAAGEVLSCIEKLHIFNDVKTIAVNLDLSLEEKSVIAMTAVDSKGNYLIETITPEVEEAYLEAVKNESMGSCGCDRLSVVYTPLNGTGNIPVRTILERIGVGEIFIVEEQELPDGRFPTCPYPNPEKKEALTLGLELCRKLMAEGQKPDLLLATDPDCDRVGIAVRHRNPISGEEDFQLLTGNEVGILLLDFICQKRLDEGSNKPMPENPLAIKTIVTSRMADRIAKNYGVHIIDVLTGFKFIGEQIGFLEKKGEDSRYIFGFEESYGYLSGSYVRDKDAVNASMLICEMTAFYKAQGKTLVDQIGELYKKYGYYINDLMEFSLEGSAGMAKMQSIMKNLREAAPKELAGKRINEIADYERSIRHIIRGEAGCVLSSGFKPISLPKSDVLEYLLEDGSSFIVRPSGTEPKLKIYLSSKGESNQDSLKIIGRMKEELQLLIKAD